MDTNLTISKSNKTIPVKLLILFILLFILGVTVIYTLTDYDLINRQNRKNNTENQKSTGNGSSNSSKPDIKIDTEKKMHQLGDHFNKHGRDLGYSSKKEYGDAALKFAQENSKNLRAQIFEGKWNGGGLQGARQQIIVFFENKSVILDKLTGQIIDFYEGNEMRGLIEIIKLQ